MSEIARDIIIDSNNLYIQVVGILEVVEQDKLFIIKFKKFKSTKYNKKDIWVYKDSISENELKIFREWCVINDYLIKG